ncbi:MAG TPA: glycosyltransferase family 4 protein [Candidatus Saccharimonadia bacterium]|nr:glycosyltransferase family 4 protein [Candidatus Saccharimonadia bacterium]
MVISQGYVGGGAENSLMLTRSELLARGHQVKILSADDPKHDLFSDYTFRTIPLHSPLKALHHLFYVRSYRALKAAIRDFQPDVIHFHTLGSCSPSILFAAGRVPAVMTIHGPEEFTLSLLPWFLGASDFKNQDFDTAHLTFTGFLKYQYFRFVQRPIYRLGLKRLRHVMAPSRYMRRTTHTDFPGVPMTVVPNGIKLPSAHALPPSPTLLFVGRIEPLKGINYLLQAFAQATPVLPLLKLRIVGTGPQLPALRQAAIDLGIAHQTEFCGWIQPSHIRNEYLRSSALVIPSICPEAFGLVAVEAMATGRPVIATDLGSLPELVTHAHTGLVVPPADANRLAAAIVQLFQTPGLLPKLAAEAAQSAQRFSITRHIDQLETIYRDATEPSATPL